MEMPNAPGYHVNPCSVEYLLTGVQPSVDHQLELHKHGLEWDDAEPGVLVVGDPLPEVVDVQILGSARFGTEVRRLIVELRPNA